MIPSVVVCDHPDCDARGPEAETEIDARRLALDAGWQRWRVGASDELLDLCPAHRRDVKAKVQQFIGSELVE